MRERERRKGGGGKQEVGHEEKDKKKKRKEGRKEKGREGGKEKKKKLQSAYVPRSEDTERMERGGQYFLLRVHSVEVGRGQEQSGLRKRHSSLIVP